MKAARILFALICTVCCLRAQLVPPAPPPPSLTLTNDRLNYYAWLVATQSVEFLLWEGGRNGVRAGESVFIEARTPEWIRDVDLKTSLTGNDLSIAWGFTGLGSSGSPPTFPIIMGGGTVQIGDFDWRNSSGVFVERGLAAVQILSGNWQVESFVETVRFTYTGPATISSLDDLAFSVRLFNSITVPEPASAATIGLGAFVWVTLRRQRSSASKSYFPFR